MAYAQGGSKTVGFLLAICGNTLIACSLTLQKHAHNALNGRSDYAHANASSDSTCAAPDGASHVGDIPHSSPADESGSTPPVARPESSYLSSSTWWTGTALMAAGEIGNFAAFAFAPASLVAPLGAWSVVLAAILAHAFLGEPTTRRNVSGILLCVSGAFLIGTAGPDLSAAEANLDADSVAKLLVRPPFVVFIAITVLSTAALIAVGHWTALGDEFIVVYIGVSSLLGGITVVCAKALSTFLRLTLMGESQFGNWLPVALVLALAAAIVTQLRYLNLAMARFGNSQVVPVYYVLFTICAMTSGVIMYKEFDSLHLNNLPFFVGVGATMSGVFLVARETEAAESDKSEFGKSAGIEDVVGDATRREWRVAVEGRGAETDSGCGPTAPLVYAPVHVRRRSRDDLDPGHV